MGMDAICLAAVVYELKRELVGGRIDKIHQPGRDEVVMAVRGNEGNVKLLLSSNPAQPRPQLTKLARENPEKPPMFCMLLRKHLVGGKIKEIIQPEGERIVIFVLDVTDELGDRVERRLVLECMGRTANLILVDGEGRIIDCIRRVEGDLATGKRQVLPGLFYRMPEPYTGTAPLITRELEFRLNRPLTKEELREEAAKLTEKVQNGDYTPTMLIREGKPVDFSFWPILQYGPTTESREYLSFGELLDEFYSTRETAERVKQKGSDLIKAVTSARDRVARKIAMQEKDLATAADRERMRELGDLLTSNLHVMQKGMGSVRVMDFYDPEGKEVEIPLDRLKTPQQNAAKYYKAYTKARTAEEMLTIQLEKGRKELEYLNSVLDSVFRAEGERDLQEIRQELIDTGYARRGGGIKAKEKRVNGKPLEFTSSTGLKILVGRNNSQNDLLTTKLADKRDIWLHTQKIHGSHVILCCGGTQPDAASLTEAAQLAAWYSQGRESGRVAVDYTPVKFVKKPAGARPGMVIYTTYQTAIVEPKKL